VKSHGFPLQLDEQERRLEDDARLNGVRRYKDKVRKRGLRSKPGSTFATKWVSFLIQAIKHEQESVLKGKIEGKFQGEKILLLTLDPERLAFVTLDCIFDGLVSTLLEQEEHKDVEARWLEDQIGRNCFMEYVADRRREYLGWAQEHRPVQELVIESYLRKKRPSAFRAAASYERKLKRHAVVLIRQARHSWRRRKEDTRLYNDYFRLGGLLIQCAERAQLVVVGKGHKKVWATGSAKEGEVTQPKVIRLTADIEASLSRDLRKYESMCSPVNSPMVRQPRPWEGLQGGGYLRKRHIHFALLATTYCGGLSVCRRPLGGRA